MLRMRRNVLRVQLGFFLVAFLVGASASFFLYAPAPLAEAQALSAEEKARLQAEYDQLQAEIAQWQKVLDETRAKKNTIQGDVSALNAQIKKAETEIKQRGTTISRLAGEINEKTNRIGQLEDRIAQGRESLAKLIREKNASETQPLVLLALSSQDLSEFFSDVQEIDAINRGLQSLFNELRGVREETEEERAALAARKDQELDAKYEVEVKKKEISKSEAEKKELLSITKNQEASYQ